MNIFLKIVLLLFALGSSSATNFEPYEGYIVYRVVPKTPKQRDFLIRLQDYGSDLDFWTEPGSLNLPVDIMVAPKLQAEFSNRIEEYGMQAKVWIDDIPRKIEAIAENSPNITWTEYHKLEPIYSWLDSLPDLYPDLVQIVSAGASFEGRDMKGVRISFGPGKRAVFIEGGAHAREWISPATVTYLIDQLLTSQDPVFRRIARSFDWHLFPIINPDGYVHSYTTFRLWRKNRAVYPNSLNCNGTDLNRNWNFTWGEHGTSSLICMDTYGGPSPFSEKETSNLKGYITPIGASLDVYLSFHSYSQLLLIPFGNTTEHLANYDDLFKIANKTMEALAQKYGTQYKAGNTVEILYEASGSSTDWVKDTFGVPITYTYELRDKGLYGFLLPSSKILPNCEEVVDSIIGMFLEAERLGYFVLNAN